MKQITKFCQLPEEYSDLDKSKIVIIPVPYDGTSTWVKGADKGPSAVIMASANMELYDIETDLEVYKKGIFTAKAINENSPPESMIESVHKTVQYYINKGKFVVVIGGEHSVSIGSIKAHVESNRNVTVLQLDAHADLRNEYNDSQYNHACVMARIKDLCPISQVGVRSMDSCEKRLIDKKNIFFAKDIHEYGNWTEKIVSTLSAKVYITIDLDVLDPSIMPSTGTPEPGGLLWYDVLRLLKIVFDTKDVVGFDVVELCPNANNKAPDFLAAKLIYKLLCYKFND